MGLSLYSGDLGAVRRHTGTFSFNRIIYIYFPFFSISRKYCCLRCVTDYQTALMKLTRNGVFPKNHLPFSRPLQFSLLAVKYIYFSHKFTVDSCQFKSEDIKK